MLYWTMNHLFFFFLENEESEFCLRIVCIIFLLCHGVFGVETNRVSVKEGHSVTLYTGVQTDQQEDYIWYFNDTRIAQISGDLSYICTDVQCNNGTERFRDRLKLDHQTGSLTIRNTRTTDSGLYYLLILHSSSDSQKIFSVAVQGVSAAERDEMKSKSVKEGESVTLDPGETKSPNDVKKWYFNDILIAEITGDQSKICTDDQCDERFRDRLKLDHQTGSLTITNTRTTDSGLYELHFITSRRRRRRSISSVKSFSVTVFTVPDSSLSSAAVAGICAAAVSVLLLLVTLSVICYRHQVRRKHTRMQHRDQVNVDLSTNPSETSLMNDAGERSCNHTVAQVMNTTSDFSPNQIEIEPEAASET